MRQLALSILILCITAIWCLADDRYIDDVMQFSTITYDPSTGVATNPTSGTVTFGVFESTDAGSILTGSMTQRTATGSYVGSITLSTANGFENGKSYAIIATATFSGTAYPAMIKDFRVMSAPGTQGGFMLLGANTGTFSVSGRGTLTGGLTVGSLATSGYVNTGSFSLGSISLTGIVNSGSLSTGSINSAGIINTGSFNTGSIAVTNVISAGSLLMSGTNSIGYTTGTISYASVIGQMALPAAQTVATTLWQDNYNNSDFTAANSIGSLLLYRVDERISTRGTSTFAAGGTVVVNGGTIASTGSVISSVPDSAGITTLLTRLPGVATINASGSLSIGANTLSLSGGGGGASAADVWSYATRTINGGSVGSVTASVNGAANITSGTISLGTFSATNGAVGTTTFGHFNLTLDQPVVAKPLIGP